MIFHVYEVTTTVKIEAESQGDAVSVIEARLKRQDLTISPSRFMEVQSSSVKLAPKKKGAR